MWLSTRYPGLLVLVAALAGTPSCGDTAIETDEDETETNPSGMDADADADVDTDADADSDADSDVDADSDTDADSDLDADSDTDMDTDGATDVDTDSASTQDSDLGACAPPHECHSSCARYQGAIAVPGQCEDGLSGSRECCDMRGGETDDDTSGDVDFDTNTDSGADGDADMDSDADSDTVVDVTPCPASATLTPGDTTISIVVDGLERSFIVHAPPSYDGRTRMPVVFDFHGLGGNGNQQKSFSGWQRAGDAHGFVTVFGNGYENAWNAGACCSDKADDVAFVRAAVETLDTTACIDTKRVYATGCSNGGGMSYKLACDAADIIAAIAPVDFDCVVGIGCADCSPSRPVSVVQFRGTNDELVPYDGGMAFSGARRNFETWRDINECTGSAEALPQEPGCETYPTCAAGVETLLCTVANGSHCGSYSTFDIPNVAWEVMRHHSLP